MLTHQIGLENTVELGPLTTEVVINNLFLFCHLLSEKTNLPESPLTPSALPELQELMRTIQAQIDEICSVESWTRNDILYYAGGILEHDIRKIISNVILYLDLFSTVNVVDDLNVVNLSRNISSLLQFMDDIRRFLNCETVTISNLLKTLPHAPRIMVKGTRGNLTYLDPCLPNMLYYLYIRSLLLNAINAESISIIFDVNDQNIKITIYDDYIDPNEGTIHWGKENIVEWINAKNDGKQIDKYEPENASQKSAGIIAKQIGRIQVNGIGDFIPPSSEADITWWEDSKGRYKAVKLILPK